MLLIILEMSGYLDFKIEKSCQLALSMFGFLGHPYQLITQTSWFISGEMENDTLLNSTDIKVKFRNWLEWLLTEVFRRWIAKWCSCFSGKFFGKF